MDRKYIKMWRKITRSPVFLNSDHELFRVWVFLLLTATFKEHEETEEPTESEVPVLRGQVLTSKGDIQAKLYRTGGNVLAKRCCWKFMQTLVDMGNIQIEESDGWAIVSIIKWDVYQAKDAHAERGYFKLWRKIQDSDVFMVPELLKIWVYCLASSGYEDVNVPPDHRVKKTVSLRKGQFIVGRSQLRKDLFGKIKRGTPSAMTCWRWLQKLADMGAIRIESSGLCSIITVNNWSAHQG